MHKDSGQRLSAATSTRGRKRGEATPKHSLSVGGQRRGCERAGLSYTYEDSPSRRSCRRTPSSRRTARTWGCTASSRCGRRTAPGCSAALERNKKKAPAGRSDPCLTKGSRPKAFGEGRQHFRCCGGADESNRGH